MKRTQPLAEGASEKTPRPVPETPTALSTGMFHPIGGLDPDMSRGPRRTKPRLGLWSRFRAFRS